MSRQGTELRNRQTRSMLPKEQIGHPREKLSIRYGLVRQVPVSATSAGGGCPPGTCCGMVACTERERDRSSLGPAGGGLRIELLGWRADTCSGGSHCRPSGGICRGTVPKAGGAAWRRVRGSKVGTARRPPPFALKFFLRSLFDQYDPLRSPSPGRPRFHEVDAGGNRETAFVATVPGEIHRPLEPWAETEGPNRPAGRVIDP